MKNKYKVLIGGVLLVLFVGVVSFKVITIDRVVIVNYSTNETTEQFIPRTRSDLTLATDGDVIVATIRYASWPLGWFYGTRSQMHKDGGGISQIVLEFEDDQLTNAEWRLVEFKNREQVVVDTMSLVGTAELKENSVKAIRLQSSDTEEKQFIFDIQSIK